MKAEDWISFEMDKPKEGQDVILLNANGITCRSKYWIKPKNNWDHIGWIYWQLFIPPKQPDEFEEWWLATKIKLLSVSWNGSAMFEELVRSWVKLAWIEATRITTDKNKYEPLPNS